MADEQPLKAKRTRGEAKLKWLSKVQRGEKIKYQHRYGVPIKKNARKIISYVGKLARDGTNFPFDKEHWEDIPDLDKSIEKALHEVQNIFHWHPESENWFLKTLSDRWRQNRHRKKKAFFDKYNYSNTEDWYAHCPPGVLESQWRAMVAYWRTPEFKKISNRNKENKSKAKIVHIAGSKSYMNHAADIEEETQKPANRVDIYKKTHRRTDAIAGDLMNQMEELQKKAVDDGVFSDECLSDLDGDIYSKVMGAEKKGRNRGVGIGVEFKKARRGSKSDSNQDNEDMKLLKEQVSTLRQQNDGLMKEREDMMKERDDMKKKYDQMEKNQEKMQKNMDKMMSYFAHINSDQEDISPMSSEENLAHMGYTLRGHKLASMN